MISRLLQKIKGIKKAQKYFERLFKLSLAGMNYGIGGNFKDSGELNTFKYIKNKFEGEENLVIFDVGANVGKYSLDLSDFFGNKTTIHSFEPSQKTFAMFLENTKEKTNILSNNFGLSDIENEKLLYTDADGSGLASVYKRNLEHFNISLSKSEKIKLSTVDNYCEKNKIKKIHLLKLDVEGHELSALKGAQKMIKDKKIDFIQFEFGGCNIDSRTYFQDFFYILKDDFRIYRILKDGLHEIPEYKETLEIFVTTNYLAEARK